MQGIGQPHACWKSTYPKTLQCRRFIAQCSPGRPERASLTKRLLPFPAAKSSSRKQVAIGELVSGMEGLLTRAFRDRIELKCQFPSALPLVLVDANQLELALLNVALERARTAMPDGGQLIISAGRDPLVPDTR